VCAWSERLAGSERRERQAAVGPGEHGVEEVEEGRELLRPEPLAERP
jgi:hypothetical protein